MRFSVFSRVATAVRRQWLVVTLLLGLGAIAATAIVLTVHDKYTATTTVLMVAEPPESGNASYTTSSGTKPLLSVDLASLATDATVLTRFRQDIGETTSLEDLQRQIRARVNIDSSVLPVQYSAETPALALKGSNALADEVVRFYREIATSRFDSLISDYNSQLATRRTELTSLDAQLASDAKTYPYIDVAAPGTVTNGTESVFQRLIAIQAERDTLRSKVQADAAAAQATSKLVGNAAPLAERDVVNSDSAYQHVHEQYAKDFAELAKISAFGNSSYPGLDELRATVARESATVDAARRQAVSAGLGSNSTYVAALDAQANAKALYESDSAQLQAEDGELGRLQAQIGQGNISTDVARIRRDRDSAEAAYATISDRLAKAIADRAEAASTGSVIVLDRARFAPKDPFAAGPVYAVAIVFFSLWLAFTLAVMIDGTNEWLRDSQTIEAVYGTQLIGSIA